MFAYTLFTSNPLPGAIDAIGQVREISSGTDAEYSKVSNPSLPFDYQYLIIGHLPFCSSHVLALHISWTAPNRAWNLQFLFAQNVTCRNDVVFWCNHRSITRN